MLLLSDSHPFSCRDLVALQQQAWIQQVLSALSWLLLFAQDTAVIFGALRVLETGCRFCLRSQGPLEYFTPLGIFLTILTACIRIVNA